MTTFHGARLFARTSPRPCSIDGLPESPSASTRHAGVTVARKTLRCIWFAMDAQSGFCGVNDMSTIYLRLRDLGKEIGLLRPIQAPFQDTVAAPLIRSEDAGYWRDSSFELEHGLEVAELRTDRLEPELADASAPAQPQLPDRPHARGIA
jgi:hypothetical protein